jgi:hypothetical protein
MASSANSLEQLVEGFATSPVTAGKAVGDLLARDRKQFYDDALEMLTTGARTPGHAYVLNLLIENDLLPEALANHSEFTQDEAVEFVKTASQIDPMLDAKLARWILNRVRSEPLEQASPAVRRILGILEQTSTGTRLAPLLVQLLRVPDPKIRSKVALLMGRGTHEVTWVLSERDPRVRANAIEAVWGVDSREMRHALWELAKDSHNRVVGNALLALCKLGEAAAANAVLKISGHALARFRATAAWVMGQTGDARFLDTLRGMDTDPDDHVRRNALLAIARIGQAAPAETTAAQWPRAPR